MRAKFIYTLFPCVLLAMTCDLGMVAQSQEASEYMVQEQEPAETSVKYTAGEAEITEKALLLENEADIRLTAGEADITREMLEDWNLEESTENIPVQEEVQAAVTEEEQENEYSNFAIADVDHYVNVRSTPNTDGEIVGKMYDGSVAQVLSVTSESDGEWFQVVSGDVEGFIKAEFFIYGDAAEAVMDEYVTRYAVVKADRLNVRQEPDLSAARIGYIDYGEKAQIIEYGGEWTKVFYTDGEEGYVASQYITVEEEFIYAKSIAEELAELEAKKKLEERAAESEEAAPENTTVEVIPPAANYTSNAELRSAIIQDAMQYLGTPYVHGGRSLASGTDCSGFTSYIYAHFGYSLSRTPQGQWGSNGRSISVSEIQPGDIVCYSSNGSKCTHVGIYIGNGQIIHEANAKKGTIISDMYYDNTFIGIKNVID